MNNNSPIGVFDSGVGGLSVFKEVIKLLPNENYIYFGDTINLPYGNKSQEELVEISSNIFDFFKSKNVKAVIMACNTTSAVTYDILKDKYDFKIYPIVQNISNCIAKENNKRIGVFATKATVGSHAYKKEITKHNPNIEVFEIACPNWVRIVENELQEDKESIEDIKTHLDEMLKNNVDKIILGCTHYPYLLSVLAKFAPEDMFINPAQYFAQFIEKDIKSAGLENIKKDYEPKFYVTSNPEQFMSASKLFYSVKQIEEISLFATK